MNVVLVLAEERAICESLRAALPETDLLLIEPTLEKGLRRLISVRVDAVFVDDAPNFGHQAVAKVLEAVPGVPIVVLSGRSDPESLASWTLAGARACVIKPFSCDMLRDAVRTVSASRELAPVFDHGIERAVYAVDAAPKKDSVNQHQMALRWLSRTSGQFDDPRRLSQSLVDSAQDIFDAARCAVLLESNGGVRVIVSHGIPTAVTESLRLTFSSGLMRWFEENPCLFDRNANRQAAGALKEMQVFGGRLAVPFMISGRVCGAFIIGEKASGTDYSFEERELLIVIGRYASTALEKAQAYRDTSIQQSRLDTVLANITAGVITVLPNKTISMMNQQAERLLQVRAVDVLGRSVQKLGSQFADVVLRTLADGKPRLRQEIRDHASETQIGMSVTPMGAEGVVVIFSKLPHEIVSRDEVAYSPFWEYLSARVAQEIKNPMVAINTFAQLLPRKYDSEDFRDSFFRVVQKEVERINGVVETLFAFARQPELVLKETNLNETVQKVLRSFEDELAGRTIKVEAEWEEQPTEAPIDEIFFSQAVYNLVRNSLEAMTNGGTLRVKTKRQNSAYQIRIGDTGPGIPPEEAPLIFMPFYSTKERGMGLGLPMAMRIMRQHEGELKLEESTANGTAFTLTLPVTSKS